MVSTVRPELKSRNIDGTNPAKANCAGMTGQSDCPREDPSVGQVDHSGMCRPGVFTSEGRELFL
jgi:hypothetical protein